MLYSYNTNLIIQDTGRTVFPEITNQTIVGLLILLVMSYVSM